MRVLNLTVSSFRNISALSFSPCEQVNVIYGENAQGKTNLLESIWLFTGCRSFRGSKDKELIQFQKERAKLCLDFFGTGREQRAELAIEEKRRASLNGIALSSPAALAGEFTAVVFSPVHLNLVKGGPAERRRFLDTALCQLKPRYAGLLVQYNRTLAQRNVLLKDISRHSELYDTLEVWEERLISLGTALIQERLHYMNGLCEVAGEVYEGLSKGREKLFLSYFRSGKEKENGELEEQLRALMRAARREDILNGTTSVGPHRDDIEIQIGGISARNFGSQGQQRSAALALKLSEATLIRNLTGEQPIALLDDVMSELDAGRQDYILNHIDGWQVFLTCCEPSSLLRLCGGKIIRLENGALK